MADLSPCLPRVAITFCTQCKWMLRAAYFGQELLSTFGTTIGEIALIPATGGMFKVELSYRPELTIPATSDKEMEICNVLLWDRKAEGGFPETKVLKQRVRDHVQPSKDLGHSDTHGKGSVKTGNAVAANEQPASESSSTKVLDALSVSDSSTLVSDRDSIGASTQASEISGPEVKRNADGSVCEDCR